MIEKAIVHFLLDIFFSMICIIDESNLEADNPQMAAAGCPLLGDSLVEKDFQPHQV